MNIETIIWSIYYSSIPLSIIFVLHEERRLHGSISVGSLIGLFLVSFIPVLNTFIAMNAGYDYLVSQKSIWKILDHEVKLK